jgi:hypothetical protein
LLLSLNFGVQISNFIVNQFLEALHLVEKLNDLPLTLFFIVLKMLSNDLEMRVDSVDHLLHVVVNDGWHPFLYLTQNHFAFLFIYLSRFELELDFLNQLG